MRRSTLGSSVSIISLLLVAGAAVVGVGRIESDRAGGSPGRRRGPVAHTSSARGAPVRFEANEGQLDERVRFVARVAGQTAFVLGADTVLQAGDDVLEMRLRGARASAWPSGVDRLAGVTHYHVGPDPTRWRADVPSFAEVRVSDVYPGIDLVHQGRGSKLEYDLVVAPGADPSIIEIGIHGAERARIDDRGDLVLEGPNGATFRQERPVIYQDREGARSYVDGAFVLAARADDGTDVVRFQTGDYDRAAPLVIDPALIVTAGFLGADGNDSAAAAVPVPAGLAIGGTTTSIAFPGASGPALGKDAFVVVTDVKGGTVSTTIFGAAGDDSVTALAVAPSGDIHVAGTTSSTSLGTMNAFQPAYGGGPTDALYARLSAAGAVEALSYHGHTEGDIGRGVAVDALGHAVMIGDTFSNGFTVTPGVIATTTTAADEGFVTKIDPNGAIVWSTFLGTTSVTIPEGVAIRANGDVHVGGYTFGGLPTTPDGYDTSCGTTGTCGNISDGFHLVLSSDATTVQHGSYFGAEGNDFVMGMKLDPANRIVLWGISTSATGFPIPATSLQPNLDGASDGFVIAFNPIDAAQNPGGLAAGTFAGGSGQDIVIDVTFLEADKWALVGSAEFPNGILQQDPVQAGASGTFVYVWNPFEAVSPLSFGSFLGASGVANGVAILDNGPTGLVTVRNTTLTTEITTPDAAQQAKGDANANNDDLFITVIDLAGGSGGSGGDGGGMGTGGAGGGMSETGGGGSGAVDAGPPPGPKADLQVEKVLTNYVGYTLQYEIYVLNKGPDTATGVEVTDFMPDNVTQAKEWKPLVPLPPVGKLVQSGDKLEAKIGSIPKDGVVSFYVEMKLSGVAKPGETITNVVQAYGKEMDPNASNNVATNTREVGNTEIEIERSPPPDDDDDDGCACDCAIGSSSAMAADRSIVRLVLAGAILSLAIVRRARRARRIVRRT